MNEAKSNLSTNNVEDMALQTYYGPNSIPVLRRILELLEQNQTNSVHNLNDPRVDACIHLLLMQRFGSLYMLDSVEEAARIENSLRALKG